MELHELHILQRQAGAQHHGVAVARAGVGRGAREVSPAIAARRQDRALRPETVDRAVFQAHGDNAAAGAVLIHHQIDGKIFDEELSRMPQRLAVERVQHGVAGAVGGGAGALCRRALAIVGRHAAEGALIDPAVFGARERYAIVLKLINRVRGVAAEIFDGVLVSEPVGPFDGIEHMPAPIVGPHVAERGRDAALGCNGVRAGRENFGDACGFEAGLGRTQRGTQARAAGTDHDHVVAVIGDLVGQAVDCRCRGISLDFGVCCRHFNQTPKLNFRMAKTLTSATAPEKNVLNIKSATL